MEFDLLDSGLSNGTTPLANLFDSNDQDMAIDNDSSHLDYNNTAATTTVSPNLTYIYLTYGIITTTIGVAGLVGNTLSIVVMSNTKTKLSINCCLIGLAVFDNLLIASAILLHSIGNICNLEESCPLYNLQMYPYFDYYVYMLLMIGQTGSVWLTVAVTIDRYIAVCFPLRARSLCTYGRARIGVVVISVLAILYNLPRILEYEEDEYLDPASKGSTVVTSWLFEHKYYFEIYVTWMYLFLIYLAPLVSLAVLNVLIWNNIRIANRERQQLSGQQNTEMRLTIMLSSVVAVFFVCNLPDLIIRTMQLNDAHSDQMHEIQDMLLITNSSVNFVIYCIFGQAFRTNLLRMMCSCCPSSFGDRRLEANGGDPMVN